MLADAQLEVEDRLNAMYKNIGVVPTDLLKGELFPKELFWREHQPWLTRSGYLLRPRYQPSWVGSWIKDSKRMWLTSEDAKPIMWGHLIDATSVKDGSQVMLKRIKPSENPSEIEIGQMFSTEPLISDARNRCAPVLKSSQSLMKKIWLLSSCRFYKTSLNLPLRRLGRLLIFFGQIFMGLQFMHSNCVAHRDIKLNNIMVDARPLYPYPPHPINSGRRLDYTDFVTPTSRTRVPVKYYFIDFGISRKYDHGASPLEPPWGAGDKTVPEIAKGELCNPYAVDIHCLGNIIRQQFLEEHLRELPKRGFGFMKDLVVDMVHDDPKSRPTIHEVVKRFEKIRRGLSSFTLRSRYTDGAET